MRQILAAAVAGLFVSGTGACRPDAPAKSIDGTYKVLSATFGGKVDTEKTAKAEFVFKDGTVSIREGGKEKDETAKYTLDPSKTPGHIDITPKSDKTVLGIYETKATKEGLELTLAFSKGGGDRPADFKGDAPGVVVLKLLRPASK
jgi:uncharacterized protein (TIGR03067 family)